MKSKLLLLSMLTLALLSYTSCSKDDNDEPNKEITVANISGTYKLTALVWKLPSGESVNVYDELEHCNHDDLIQLNADMTGLFIDAGIVCDPPNDQEGDWELNGDQITFGGVTSTIKQFDGKTLVITGQPLNEPGVQATTTLRRQ